jgi:hypothetical protein
MHNEIYSHFILVVSVMLMTDLKMSAECAKCNVQL